MSYCDDCLHKEVCGEEGVGDESMTFCRDKVISCEDAISRQAVIDGINSYFHDEYYQRTSIQDCRDCLIEDVIKKLPPVNPQPKTGKWIQTNEFFINQDGQFIYKFICSECKSLSYFRKSNKKAIGANVCPNCGCRMIEPQGDEKTETWNGIHAQITAPKGTFERIFNDAADNNDSDI